MKCIVVIERNYEKINASGAKKQRRRVAIKKEGNRQSISNQISGHCFQEVIKVCLYVISFKLSFLILSSNVENMNRK
jgi:hypothetical protein